MTVVFSRIFMCFKNFPNFSREIAVKQSKTIRFLVELCFARKCCFLGHTVIVLRCVYSFPFVHLCIWATSWVSRMPTMQCFFQEVFYNGVLAAAHTMDTALYYDHNAGKRSLTAARRGGRTKVRRHFHTTKETLCRTIKAASQSPWYKKGKKGDFRDWLKAKKIKKWWH